MKKTYTIPAPIPKKIVFWEKGSSSFIKKQHPWHNNSAFETIYKFLLIAKHIKKKTTIQQYFSQFTQNQQQNNKKKQFLTPNS